MAVYEESPPSGAEKELLLLEYERSSEFCNHVDNVRNVITSFFLTLVGAAVIAIDRFTSSDPGAANSSAVPAQLVAVLVGVSGVGSLFVLVIARLRRVQLERYQLMNGLLDILLVGPARDLVPLRNSGISGRSGATGLGRRSTGSYYWTLIIVLPSAGLFGVAVGVGLTFTEMAIGWLAASGTLFGSFYLVVVDYWYFRLSQY